MKNSLDQSIYNKLIEYYDGKTHFRKGKALRVLTVMRSFECTDCKEKFDFTYEMVDIYENKEIILEKIYDFKPDIIWTFDSDVSVKKIFEHRNILYITVNDFSLYFYLLKDRHYARNEIGLFFQSEKMIRQFCNDETSKHVIHIEYIEDSNFLDANIKVANEFRTDIMVAGVSNGSLSRCKKYINEMMFYWMVGSGTVKEDFLRVLDMMIDELYQKMDVSGSLIEDVKEYAELFNAIAYRNKVQFDFVNDVSDEDLQYFYHMLRVMVGYPVFRFLVVKWIIERGYKVELYGDVWKDEVLMKKNFAGIIERDDREKLKQAYNGAKICLFTNPDLSMHFSVFEIIGSKSLCLAYENERVSCSKLLSECFEDGKSIALYHNREELLKKIDYYLSDLHDRKQVIEAGNKIMMENNMCWENELSKAVHQSVRQAEENGMFQ